MTDKEYAKRTSNGEKLIVYKVYVKGVRIYTPLSKTNFDDSWISRSWLNTTVAYDTENHCHFIYATEDYLAKAKQKLIDYLRKDEIDIIAKAQKRLDALNKIAI